MSIPKNLHKLINKFLLKFNFNKQKNIAYTEEDLEDTPFGKAHRIKRTYNQQTGNWEIAPEE